MRQIVLDTETTGIHPHEGHRLIEIGCIELLERRPSDRHFHRYVNPQRDVPEEAYRVHGLNAEFLADKPLFASVVDDFLRFVDGAELLIHNAAFDVGFLDNELSLLDGDWPRIGDICSITDTLKLAREMHPGQRNTLDALCRRYGVDNAQRQLHGALLDSQLLAEVFLAMTAGQSGFEFDSELDAREDAGNGLVVQSREVYVQHSSELELEIHKHRLEQINSTSGGDCLWLQLETSS